ncbi:hypothetical protein KRX54_01070 [Actinomycetaceae bacterium TAE3-ERU4]|nr:hypothetical protein [Actinomycetaceae bacterium TAE3-ERU4]
MKKVKTPSQKKNKFMRQKELEARAAYVFMVMFSLVALAEMYFLIRFSCPRSAALPGYTMPVWLVSNLFALVPLIVGSLFCRWDSKNKKILLKNTVAPALASIVVGMFIVTIFHKLEIQQTNNLIITLIAALIVGKAWVGMFQYLLVTMFPKKKIAAEQTTKTPASKAQNNQTAAPKQQALLSSIATKGFFFLILGYIFRGTRSRKDK